MVKNDIIRSAPMATKSSVAITIMGICQDWLKSHMLSDTVPAADVGEPATFSISGKSSKLF